MTEQHILNELYKAQADLEKAQGLVHAYQDVIRAAIHLVHIADEQSSNATTTGGGVFNLAYLNLKGALHAVIRPNGEAE
jgi:hypothetical protein